MARETWVGLAWVGALVVAIAGVFLFESARFSVDAFDAQWRSRTVPASADGMLRAGENLTFSFPVPGNNVSMVQATLVWQDDDGGPDRFRLRLAGPGSYGADETGDAGTLETSVDVMPLPSSVRVYGSDAEDALARLQYPEPAWEGMRNWNVHVTLEDAPGQMVAGQEVVADGTNDFDLEFLYHAFEPRVVLA